jgi:hypothetical protein
VPEGQVREVQADRIAAKGAGPRYLMGDEP